MKNYDPTWWRHVVLTSGKFKGRSIFWVYVNAQDYLCGGEYTVELKNPTEVMAVTKAIEHKNKVDPCYHDEALAGGFRD